MKMTIDKPVKYNKVKYAPGEIIEVAEEHVEALRKEGAVPMEQSEKVNTSATEKLPSHTALVARCEELGIEVGNKQDKTLIKLIKEAEAKLEKE